MGNSFVAQNAWALFSMPGTSLQGENRTVSMERVENPSQSSLKHPAALQSYCPSNAFRQRYLYHLFLIPFYQSNLTVPLLSAQVCSTGAFEFEQDALFH